VGSRVGIEGIEAVAAENEGLTVPGSIQMHKCHQRRSQRAG